MSLRGQQRREFPQSVRVALPSAEIIRDRLTYDPASGDFRWRGGGQIKAGTIAGSIDRKGYRIIKIGTAGYKAHRLAWVYMTGGSPVGDIDHINGCKSDNRWANLREATQSQNTANSKIRSDNESGFKGVTKVTGCSTWQARIGKNGKSKYLGLFETPELAHAAYLAEAKAIFGDFANGGTK